MDGVKAGPSQAVAELSRAVPLQHDFEVRLRNGLQVIANNGERGLYQVRCLYQPPDPQVPTSDIIFFHGLQLDHDAAKDTWLRTWCTAHNEGSSTIWPATWVPEKFPSSRVLSVQYRANAFKIGGDGKLNWGAVADNLVDLMYASDVGGKQQRIVMVGHSMGGLMIKQMIGEIHRRSTVNNDQAGEWPQSFMRNLAGVVFYATPHKGSFLADWSKNMFAKLFVQRQEHILERLEVFNEDTDKLNRDFGALKDKCKLKVLCFAEELPTQIALGIHKVVVEAASALMSDTDVRVAADHFGVCKPWTKADVSYTRFVDFVRGSLN